MDQNQVNNTLEMVSKKIDQQKDEQLKKNLFLYFNTFFKGQYSTPKPNNSNVDLSCLVVENGMITVKSKKNVVVCGVLNKYKKPCQRIGKCPFHSKKKQRGKKVDRMANNTPVPLIQKKKRSWMPEEHLLFLKGLQLCGKGSWKAIEKIVKSRTSSQIQAHANRYFKRQKIEQEKINRSINDFDLDDFENLERLFSFLVKDNFCYPQN